MNELPTSGKISPEKIAIDSMERYSGSKVGDFCDYLLVTNFPRYVDYFASSRGLKTIEGSTFKVAHCPKDNISILDFKIGSPMAALAIDLCAYLPIKGILMLGMAGGLRDRYEIGDFFVPVASIRGDGTSDFYFPAEVPALANFDVQRVVTEVLESEKIKYHLGITHTTNRRFWEFNEEFKQHILGTRPQAIEMECATLFIASYKHKVSLGALLLISDLPLKPEGIKTKESSERVYGEFTAKHVEVGVRILHSLEKRQQVHGYYNRHEYHNRDRGNASKPSEEKGGKSPVKIPVKTPIKISAKTPVKTPVKSPAKPAAKIPVKSLAKPTTKALSKLSVKVASKSVSRNLPNKSAASPNLKEKAAKVTLSKSSGRTKKR